MTAVEAARKLAVWRALSNLFLDTELDERDYASIAGALVESGFDDAALKRIFDAEVTPAFACNLMQVAGEWRGWSDADIAAAIARSRPSWSGGLFRGLLLGDHCAREWAKVAAAVQAKRALASS